MVAIVRVMVTLALLLVTTPAWGQAPPPGASPATVGASSNALQGFSIVLVLGDVQDGATSDNIPAAARAALADLKDFLPYRSYRVLDTAWVLASSATRQAVSSRLQGPDEQSYEVTLDRIPVGASSLQVGFEMRDPSGNPDRRRAADRGAMLRKQYGQLVEQLRRAEAAQNRGEVDALRQRIIDIEGEIEDAQQKETRYASGAATLIDTSFTMSLGETVVVGTSRMRGGNKALIILLTAVTRGAKPKE
jgi:hypothetical protein